MSADEVAIVQRWYDLLDDAAVLTRDDKAMERLEREMGHFVSPNVKSVVIAPSFTNIRYERSGIAGFRQLWGDWLRPFHSYRIEVEELVDLGDRVLALTIGRALLNPESPPIVTRAATIWTVKDGQITQLDSYLDREEAERVAYGSAGAS